MGTTTEKLTYLQGTKDAIKNAIVAKGVEVPEGTTFRGYAEKVGEIQVGGGILNATITLENNTGKNGNLRLVFIDADGHKTKMEGTEVKTVNVKSGEPIVIIANVNEWNGQELRINDELITTIDFENIEWGKSVAAIPITEEVMKIGIYYS